MILRKGFILQLFVHRSAFPPPPLPPIFDQDKDYLAEHEANPPCSQDEDCLCYPAITFCLSGNQDSGKCVVNCTHFCGPNVPCLVEHETTGSKDLTCHLDKNKIKCPHSKIKIIKSEGSEMKVILICSNYFSDQK